MREIVIDTETTGLSYKTGDRITEVGCVELINILEVSNINTSLKYLKKLNFWVSGFDLESDKDFTKHEWKGNNVVLFGSEGFGLNYQTKKNADFLLKININNKVESLNIANSASIVFHYIDLYKKKINFKCIKILQQ